MDRRAHQHSDENKGNWLIPNFRPEMKMCPQPLRERLVITKASQQTQHPTGQVEHTVDEATTPTVDHTQQDHDNEYDINCVDCHGVQIFFVVRLAVTAFNFTFRPLSTRATNPAFCRILQTFAVQNRQSPHRFAHVFGSQMRGWILHCKKHSYKTHSASLEHYLHSSKTHLDSPSRSI